MKIFGFAGWSGSGKTTLIEKLIPALVAQGLVVSLVKRAHHAFDVDYPGKDSYRHRQAGCTEVLISSERRWALMHELRGEAELTLAQCIARMSPCDLLLVEGNKHYPLPKLEVFREANGKPLLHPGDAHVLGVATDDLIETRLPRYSLDDIPGIADFVINNAIEKELWQQQ